MPKIKPQNIGQNIKCKLKNLVNRELTSFVRSVSTLEFIFPCILRIEFRYEKKFEELSQIHKTYFGTCSIVSFELAVYLNLNVSYNASEVLFDINDN